MDLSLTDEQEFLREAARGALGRTDTVAAARDALESPPATLPDLWPTAVEAGWPGLLTSEEHGGAGLGLYDAMLVAQETGRVIAPVPLASVLPATVVLDAADDEEAVAAATGDLRVAWLPAAPPTDLDDRWTVAARAGRRGADLPRATVTGDRVRLDGEVAWVPDAPGADRLVVIGRDPADRDAPVAVMVDATAPGVEVESLVRYDATRPLGHVRLDGAEGRRLTVDVATLERVWNVAQALLAAEAVGTVETLLETSVAYAKERHTFGRAIGSYQAVKHGLVEILRLLENARSLMIHVAWADEHEPRELPLAAAAARSAAGAALDHASRESIAVHGGIGATWEHDAPLYFRRAQLWRRLVGGTAAATDRVAAELLAGVVPS